MRKFLFATTATISLVAVAGTPMSVAAATPKSEKTPSHNTTLAQNNPVAPTTPPPPKHYSVQGGDSLSSIADANNLTSWREIWNINPAITDPNLIYPQQDLVIPDGPTPDRPLPVTVNAAPLDAASQAYNAVRPTPPPRPIYQPKRVVTNPNASSGDIFARIRMRESGGNYAANTGNHYYGAYQYDLGTWGNYGGYARPDLAPPAVQDAKAAQTYAARGCSPWPNTCY